MESAGTCPAMSMIVDEMKGASRSDGKGKMVIQISERSHSV
jgi:hypothetical protein